MVYRGKPSSACAECRKRRSRCDRKTPSCGPCTKANRACHGYRDLLDLSFCDETSSITKKTHPVPIPPIPGSDLQQQAPQLPIQMRDIVIYQHISDLGINFFMKTYVGSQAILSQFDFLPSFYLRDGRTCPYVSDSIKAVGLAGYAKATRRQDLLYTTTKTYISAIREVNNALSDPVLAGKDQTLIAVLLLAMYEVLILPGRKGLHNLTKHLHGAVSVAAYGQQYKEKTAIGDKLLICLCQIVTFNSWMQDIPLPPRFMALRRHINQRPGRTYNIHWHFLGILAELIEFRTALRTSQYTSATVIIDRALELDESIKMFAGALASRMTFEEVFTARDLVLTFGGYYHVYRHIASAHLLNNIRAARIRLHCVVIKQCDILLSRAQDTSKSILRASSVALVREMSREICATVPQMCGYHLQLDTQPEEPNNASTSAGYSTTTNMSTTDMKATTHGTRLSTSAIPPATTPQPSHNTPCTQFLPSSSLISHTFDPSTTSNNKPTSTSKPRTRTSTNPTIPIRSTPPSTPLPLSLYPTLPVPQGQSLYSTLYHLHMLSEIDILDEDMKTWVKCRIDWIRWKAEVHKLELLGALLEIRSVWC